jgi:hypothetical protein
MPSVRKLMINRKDSLLHVGYDYNGKVLQNTMTKSFYNSNTLYGQTLKKCEDITYETIESIKCIKTFANIAMDADEKRFI